MAVRDRADSWRRRRDEYHQWLAYPGSFCIAAEEDGAVVGYALVRLGQGDDTWRMEDPSAELETLAVLPEFRGRGIGGALMDAVEEELSLLGVRDLLVAVVSANAAALRFYERRGLAPLYVRLYRRRQA